MKSNNNPASTVTVTFKQPDGSIKTVPAEVGKSLLDVAHQHSVDLEGACEGSLACSTCMILACSLFQVMLF
jgi:ferredoxin